MDEKSKFHCNLCNESFRSNLTFVRHIKNNHEHESDIEVENQIKKFLCLKCDKEYVCKSSILTHIEKVHTGSAIKCNQCDYQTTRQETLNLHIQYEHEGREWKYKCEKCVYKFKLKGDLTHHVRVAHENYILKCTDDGCDAEFTSRGGLRSHKAKFHLHEEYSCKECEKTFPI